MATIREANGPADMAEVRDLFEEYAESLGIDLGFQDFNRELAAAAIRFAREAGYRSMRLDTLPTMTAAQALYRQLGFTEVPAYRYNPHPGATYMALALRGGS